MKEKKTNNWHSMSAEETLSALQSDAHKGLSKKQYTLRRRQCGDNAIWRVKRASAAHTALGEFLDLSAILLLITAVISAVFQRGTEALLLAGILCVSAAVRTVMFIAAQRIFEDAARSNIPHASVLRGGKFCVISADAVVPGDVLLFSPGDPVVADVRLLSGEVLVSENGVTENRGVQRKSASSVCAPNTVCEERSNILFAGATVIGGTARGVAVASGEDTYIFAKRGYITVPAGEELSVLHALSGWCRTVSLIMLAAVLVITLGGLFAGKSALSLDALFLSAISLAVAAMSEFLCVIAAIILSVSVQRLRAKSGGSSILRAADSMESFAKTECVIFGNPRLLQSGNIRLHCAYAKGAFLTDSELEADTNVLHILTMALLCRCGSLNPISGGGVMSLRDECTEMIRKIYAQYYTEEQLRSVSVPSVIAENHTADMHTVLSSSAEGTIAYLSGEVEHVLPCCYAIQGADGVRPLREPERLALLEQAQMLSRQSIRTVAVAMRPSPYTNLSRVSAVQTKMIFVGFCALLNPIDADFVQMAAKCHSSGIRTVVLTEDEETGRLLSGKAGIISEQDEVLKTVGQVESFASGALMQDLDRQTVQGACVLVAGREMRGEVVRALSEHFSDTVYVGDALRDIPLFSNVSASVAAEDAFRPAPQCLLSAADASVTSKEGAHASCGTQVLEIIAICKGAFVHLRDAAEYLLTVQSFRMTLMCAAAFLGMPLHTPVQTLWWGLMLDFAAVLAFAFSESSSAALGVPRREISIPAIKNGLLFPVSLGILSGILLSLSSAYMLRDYTEALTLTFSYFGGIFSSFALLLSIFLTRRQPKKHSLRLNAAMLAYVVLFLITAVFSWVRADWHAIALLIVSAAVPFFSRLLHFKLTHSTN